jgi:FlaA1/EpsC-like NDP-sugar epimerase
VVLVTGAAGSIGRGITIRLLEFNPRHLILLDMAETPLHELELELTRNFPGRKITFVLSDVRSKSKICDLFSRYRPDLVFHAAAYKHVPVIEQHPCEGILTNIWGTINTARAAIVSGVEKFVMISTDKAVNPTNVMGATKRIAELCVRGLGGNGGGTKFIITRFGNVLGSNGSVIPIFREQIALGGPLTVTHPEMTRYFMTIPEACRLVLQAAAMGSGDEIFVFDMGQQVKIDNLARRMILLSGLVPDEDIMVEYTGLRPGEKLYEELLSEAEATVQTQNEKIRIVTTDRIETTDIERDVAALIRSAVRCDADASVRLMKKVIPEFKSVNSPYEALDSEVVYGE